jgi:SsrA-binding protein
MSSALIKNRKAYHNYNVLEKFEAGISLLGTEVKSCRAAKISLQDSYAQPKDGELFLHNCHIGLYEQGNINNHEPTRPRKLLMHKREISKLEMEINRKGLTLVPLKFYLKRGKIKVQLGLCQGKTHGDKRESLKKKDAQRSIDRSIRNLSR